MQQAKTAESALEHAVQSGNLFWRESYKYTNKAKDKVKLEMTEGKLKGTIEMVKTAIDPPTWQGTWKLEDGSSAHMVIRMLKD